MSQKPDGTGMGRTPHVWRPNRREFLFVGLVGGLGLSLPEFLRLEAQAADPTTPGASPAAQSVIHIFLPGGISAQEAFDPKPYAPIEYRGPYGSIPTAIEGVRINEMLKETAKVADRITLCRSMTHGEAAHERGVHNMFTGYRPSPAVTYASMGSIVSHELGPRKDLPPYVCIPNQPNPFAGPGYLSSAFGPFSLGGDPAKADFSVRDLNLPKDVTPEGFARRRDLLQQVDRHFKTLEQSDAIAAMDTFYQRAYDLVSSDEAKGAFDIEAEPAALRDRYGRNQAGQRMLMARRLVEAGVRFVSLTYGGWDHHQNIKDAVAKQLPEFDKAYAALIRDLDDRGLLDSTLVMVSSEFGRTPKINKDGGRDHWPKVFSILLAGGGIKRGFVYGASDATSSEPADRPLTVENLAATIYRQLGVDHRKRLLAGSRPVVIVKDGEPVEELLS